VSREFLKYLGIGLATVVVLIAAVLFWTRGSHIQLKGSILKVRTQAMDERSAVAAIDFRFANPANYPFVVRTVSVYMTDASGRKTEGMAVAEVDAKKLFEYYPLLGQKYNESLLMRDRVGPKQSMDRMVCVRFEMPEESIEARQGFRIRIQDVDGAVSEIIEEKQ